MPYKKQSPLLNKDIQLLPFSATVKKMLATAGFSTLKDFLKLPFNQWQKRIPRLTRRYRKEIVFYLLETDLEDLIKLI